MIDVALKFLTEELNAYLLARTALSFGKASLSPVVDEAGKWKATTDSLGCFLLGLEEERHTKEHLPSYTYRAGQKVQLQPPLKLNLNVMFFAHFQNYEQALKYLSLLLTFFQRYGAFNPAQYPGMPSGLDKLIVELQSPSYEQLNQIWAFIGGKYLPSALYKIRMTVLQDDAESDVLPPLHDIRYSLVRT